MNNPQATIATAIVDRINAGEYSQPITARRAWLAHYDTEELAETRVDVVPVELEIEDASRTRAMYRWTFGIGIQRKIDLNDLSTADELAQLTFEIARWLRWVDPTARARDRWAPANCEPGDFVAPGAPDSDALASAKWLSLILATYIYAP